MKIPHSKWWEFSRPNIQLGAFPSTFRHARGIRRCHGSVGFGRAARMTRLGGGTSTGWTTMATYERLANIIVVVAKRLSSRVESCE
jgi:hypothetical protein